MTAEDVEKCLISYGFYPMTLIIKELEEKERYEDCEIIVSAMKEFKSKFTIVTKDVPTRWSKKFEKEYFSLFKKTDFQGNLLINGRLDFYLRDIKNRLKIY